MDGETERLSKGFITVCEGKANDVRIGSRSGPSEDCDLTSSQAHFLGETFHEWSSYT